MAITDFPWPLFAGPDAQWIQGQASEQIFAGQVVAWRQRDRRYYLAKNNGTPTDAKVRGIALNSTNFADQWLRVLTGGSLLIDEDAASPLFETGTVYVLGETPGTLERHLFQTSYSYTTLIGVGGPARQLQLCLFASGVLRDVGAGTDPTVVAPRYYQGLAGEAVMAGNAVMLSRDDDRLFLASNGFSKQTAAAIGLAVNVVDFAEQPLRVQCAGAANYATVIGHCYAVGEGFGSIIEASALANGQFVTVLGVGGVDNKFLLHPFASGIQMAI